MTKTNEQRRRDSGAAMEASRRNSGEAMEKSRRQSGQAMEASRRAGGAAMEARRRGQQVVEDINSLATPPVQRKTLRTIGPVGALPPRRGSGVYQAPAAGGGTGGGIASPLIEKTKTVEGEQVPDRSYYESVLLPTTDGLVWARWRSVKTIRMTDANGETVVMEYGNDLSE